LFRVENKRPTGNELLFRIRIAVGVLELDPEHAAIDQLLDRSVSSHCFELKLSPADRAVRFDNVAEHVRLARSFLG
jgi:hypothetical protein